ncbi:uncharacterized protein PV07_02596 [Cladophialophora immunda]|uniref:AMP-binding enzyme C-terminal domain-containing protein n=1 Tax=Cladophialophora immunda TaxID=569365 RepID=A0A0D2D5F8_9EURO|nr:uncharacterized protein PV07_02596 [Cladophialophora immunda]KIW30904.1 hypothetical protein PV07_02596 [Cladophialophora immunda]
MEDNLDCTLLLPSHTGPNVFPNSPFFGKLLRHARRGRVAVVAVKTPSDLAEDGVGHQWLTIERLRADLRVELTPYKLPTLLRVVQGELPEGGRGKVQKKILGPQMFPPGWRTDADVRFWDPQRNKGPRPSIDLTCLADLGSILSESFIMISFTTVVAIWLARRQRS